MTRDEAVEKEVAEGLRIPIGPARLDRIAGLFRSATTSGDASWTVR